MNSINTARARQEGREPMAQHRAIGGERARLRAVSLSFGGARGTASVRGRRAREIAPVVRAAFFP